MGAIDRIKEKALKARNIAPNAIKAFEADLDGLLAEEEPLNRDRIAAVGSHHDAIAGVRSEISGVRAAIDILSNGEPPLPESPPVLPASPAAQNKIATPTEHAMAIAAGKIPVSPEYYEFIDKLRATNAAPV